MSAEVGSKSKYDFFLEHQPYALEAHKRGPDVFGEETPLYRELRVMYDWMAQEKNAVRIPSRLFKSRLPEIHKKFPELAKSFGAMDYNSDGILEWEEFLRYCLTEPRMQAMMSRGRLLTVYGLDQLGKRAFKDMNDPAHMCETGVAPPLLPWEVAHVVEWRIENLTVSRKGAPCMYGGMPLRPGASIASPPFRAAGVCGVLRFWPVGYYSEPQRRRKATLPVGSDDAASSANDGAHRPFPAPTHDSWCCLGVASLPHGTRLQLRFFVGSAKSEKRDCTWREGVHASQLWSPPGQTEAPPDVKNGETLIVGVEILKNYDGQHWGKTPGRPNTTMSTVSLRARQRPAIQDPILISGSPLLGRAQHGEPAHAKRIEKARSLPQLVSQRP